MYHLNCDQIICFLDFKLIAEKKECTGDEIIKGFMKNIHLCYNACKGKASMFLYGVSSTSRCNNDGCACVCETASTNGECTMTDHYGFNLYAYTLGKVGEIVMTITFFRV